MCHLQIVAGLRKHIEQPQLEGSLVIVILNLKTARLAGEASEGCAFDTDEISQVPRICDMFLQHLAPASCLSTCESAVDHGLEAFHDLVVC